MNFLRSVLQIFSDRIDQTTVSFTKRINKILVKSAIENTPMSNIRDKPFIVICGCTGTGKTKLSIQMAQWLMKNNKNCEIINADAMQVCFYFFSQIINIPFFLTIISLKVFKYK